jgi:hypothetical protein
MGGKSEKIVATPLDMGFVKTKIGTEPVIEGWQCHS